MSSSPIPWRLGDPKANPAITFEGSPSAPTADEATAAINKFLEKGYDPWLVAVKLKDEQGVVHPRGYLGKPPSELMKRGVAVLPTSIRNAMESMPGNTSAGAVAKTVATTQNRSPVLLNQIKDSLERDPNALLVGPPGTGKTVALEDLREQFLAEAGAVCFDPDLWDDNWSEVQGDSRKAISLVFHPSYGYEDFVAGLMPSMSNTNGFSLTARPGPLVSMRQATMRPEMSRTRNWNRPSKSQTRSNKALPSGSRRIMLH
jgi:5-methylcytosine-specific restriction protein B